MVSPSPLPKRDSDFLGLKKELPPRRNWLLGAASFLLPLVLWSIVSYVPWLWHPLVHITDAGEVEMFSEGMDLPRADFDRANAQAVKEGLAPGNGVRVNPVYLPAPHEVARAFYTAFTTPPRLPGEPWLHQSLWHSVKVIASGFLLSSLIGVPLGILCGSFRFFSRLHEPFIEFFRYLPAPAFGALCVAMLGIHDAPKVAIIFIGTFFQQVLVIANTVRKVDPGLIEAAQTLGASRRRLVTRVIIPSSIPEIFTDMRILLGWAWTYLIVAEIIGATSGLTWFINQQARYRNFDNVYAAICLIGFIGLGTDILLAKLGTLIFPWRRRNRGPSFLGSLITRLIKPLKKSISNAGSSAPSATPDTTSPPTPTAADTPPSA